MLGAQPSASGGQGLSSSGLSPASSRLFGTRTPGGQAMACAPRRHPQRHFSLRSPPDLSAYPTQPSTYSPAGHPGGCDELVISLRSPPAGGGAQVPALRKILGSLSQLASLSRQSSAWASRTGLSPPGRESADFLSPHPGTHPPSQLLLASLSVRTGFFRPCCPVKTAEETELPQGLELRLPSQTGRSQKHCSAHRSWEWGGKGWSLSAGCPRQPGVPTL